MKRRIVVGITGASGAPYARKLLAVLRRKDEVEPKPPHRSGRSNAAAT